MTLNFGVWSLNFDCFLFVEKIKVFVIIVFKGICMSFICPHGPMTYHSYQSSPSNASKYTVSQRLPI